MSSALARDKVVQIVLAVVSLKHHSEVETDTWMGQSTHFYICPSPIHLLKRPTQQSLQQDIKSQDHKNYQPEAECLPSINTQHSWKSLVEVFCLLQAVNACTCSLLNRLVLEGLVLIFQLLLRHRQRMNPSTSNQSTSVCADEKN